MSEFLNKSLHKTVEPTAENLSELKLWEIAHIVKKDWGSKIYFAAVPYLDAMNSLDKVTDMYIMDTGRSIVAYFLSNARTWRGETAKAVKKHLNKLIK
jgi:hypothetical protein